MSAPEVTVIDYGVGNLLSVQRGLEHCGAVVTLTSDPAAIRASSKVVLPGVGAFRDAMQALRRLALTDTIREVAHRGTPFLGICLGMQLLLDVGEEFGESSGLELIPGRVVPMPPHASSGEPLKIPHIGWNALIQDGLAQSWNDTLLQDNRPGEAVYFVHSFMAMPTNASHRLAACLYGDHRISAVIAKDNIIGCQFHPEKSGEAGLKMLRRFCAN